MWVCLVKSLLQVECANSLVGGRPAASGRAWRDPNGAQHPLSGTSSFASPFGIRVEPHGVMDALVEHRLARQIATRIVLLGLVVRRRHIYSLFLLKHRSGLVRRVEEGTSDENHSLRLLTVPTRRLPRSWGL